MNPILLVLGWLWSLPTTIIGLLMALFGWTKFDSFKGPYGAMWFVVKPGGLFGLVNQNGFIATTFGCLTICSPDYIDSYQVQRHESRHTWQSFLLGPLFLPVYGAASLISWITTGQIYWNNCFEKDARDY